MTSSLETECNRCSDYNDLVKKTIFFKNVSQQIMEKKALSSLLKDIMDGSKQLLNAEASSLLIYDNETKRLYFTVAEGEKGKLIKSAYVKLGEGFAGWVAEHKQTLRVEDCYADDRFNPEFDLKTGFKTKNMLCAPMIRKGELIGVIQVINKIGESVFSDQDVSFFNALAAQCAIAIENARLVEIEIESEQLNTELNTARKIQQKILPSELPALSIADIEFKLIPAKYLGGDYYNVIRINDDICLMFIADVSGKSVSASLIVASLYSFIHTYLIVNTDDFDVKNFVESLNKFLIASTTSDKFVTAWFGLINEREKKLYSISAGHDPTYFFAGGKAPLRLIENGGLILGLMNLPYEVEEFHLKTGDTFVVYTDGVTEAMNSDKTEYGVERFQSVLINNLDKKPTQILDAVLKDITMHRKDEPQSDDITMGIIRIK